MKTHATFIGAMVAALLYVVVPAEAELSLDQKRRDISFLSLALTGEGVVDLTYVAERLVGNISFQYDDTGWGFALSGTSTRSRPFTINGTGLWEGPVAASGSWTIAGSLGSDVISGGGFLDLDSSEFYWSMDESLGTSSQEWRTDLFGPMGEPGFLTVTETLIHTTGWEAFPQVPGVPSGIDGEIDITEGANNSFTMAGTMSYYHGSNNRAVFGGFYSVAGQGTSASGTVIPEPASLSLGAIGLGGLLVVRRRR